MAWVLVRSLASLREDLNETFPNRDKESDGTIGDDDHKEHPSGHNPDDTPGSKAEYTDADTKAEVRAYDADNDLRADPAVDFQQVIDAILATPEDRDRLAYIIHRRRIWRKRNGWRNEAYSGDNAHDKHGHFSGDPAYDEDDRPWTSVLKFKGDNDMTPDEYRVLANTHDRTNAMVQNLPTYTVDGGKKTETNKLAAELAAMKAEIALLRTTLKAALEAGDGNLDTAFILSEMDRKLKELAKEQRDAVADLGINEAAVRAGSGADA